MFGGAQSCPSARGRNAEHTALLWSLQDRARPESSLPVRIPAGKHHEVWKCSPLLNHRIKGVKPNRNTPEIVFATINDAENEYGWNSAGASEMHFAVTVVHC